MSASSAVNMAGIKLPIPIWLNCYNQTTSLHAHDIFTSGRSIQWYCQGDLQVSSISKNLYLAQPPKISSVLLMKSQEKKKSQENSSFQAKKATEVSFM